MTVFEFGVLEQVAGAIPAYEVGAADALIFKLEARGWLEVKRGASGAADVATVTAAGLAALERVGVQTH